MGFITKTQVKKAIALGTLNPKVIDAFFSDIRYKSYNYDYLIQDQLIDIYTDKRDLKSVFLTTEVMLNGVRDGYKDKVSILQLDKSIVHYSRRKAFRHFSLYNKPLTQDTIMSNKDIFKYGVLVFINGVLYTDFRIQPRDDKTFIVFPYSKLDTIVKDTDVISTVMIPDSFIAMSRVMSGQDRTQPKRIKASVFENVDLKSFEACSGFVAFFVKKSTTYRPLFYSGVVYDATNREFVFESSPASIDGYYLVMVGMENFDSVFDVSAASEYFQIPKHNMPIPKNNLLVMVQDSNGYSYRINTDEIAITERYPYVYQVHNPTRKAFKVIVLYSNKPTNDMIDYDTEIDFYLGMMNILNRYLQQKVPDFIANYKPVDWDYLIKNYNETIGIPTPTTDLWYPFLYKLRKISSIYKIWCLFFQTYIRYTYGFLENWVLDVSKIDLTKRYRTSTLPDIPMSSIYYRPFVRPMYLFKYKLYSKDEHGSPYAWFIDGRFATPDYTVTLNGYQYVYFDTSLIKANSFIEVERADDNFFSVPLNVTDNMEVKVNWLERPTLMNTLFLTNEDGDYLISGEYRVFVKDPNGFESEDWYEINLNESVFILENGMSIKLVPGLPEYNNKTVYLNCNNKATVWKVSTKGRPIFSGINFNDNQIDRVKKNIISRVRIYNYDGRLYPKYTYLEKERTNIGEVPEFEAYVGIKNERPFQVQYMGYDERLIYQLDTIPINGLINLEGKIDRPFSLTYHTVFLNGYKLSERNITIISPFTIYIHDVNSVSDFFIYERVHAEEMFNCDVGPTSESGYIADILLREDEDYYQKLLRNLTDIVIDPKIGDMDDEVDMMLALIKLEIAPKFVNMDEWHSAEDWGKYDSAFFGWSRLFLNADDRVEYFVPRNYWFYLSHDDNIELNGK